MRKLVGWLGLMLLVPLGCTSTEPSLRPPKGPEEFNGPPNEPAYGRPIEYPKDAMDGDPLQRKAKQGALPGMMNGPGAPGGGRTPGM